MAHAPMPQFIVSGHFVGSGERLERIVFDGGAVWEAADIESRTFAGTANTLTGTAGNDLFIVDSADDNIVEGPGGGNDTVETFLTYTLPVNVENLTLTGHLAVDGNGNELANTIRGNDADNMLNGWGGADTLYGGQGDDTYTVDIHRYYRDEVIENAGEGIDTILVNATYDETLVMPANVENATLLGAPPLPGVTSSTTSLPDSIGSTAAPAPTR